MFTKRNFRNFSNDFYQMYFISSSWILRFHWCLYLEFVKQKLITWWNYHLSRHKRMNYNVLNILRKCSWLLLPSISRKYSMAIGWCSHSTNLTSFLLVAVVTKFLALPCLSPVCPFCHFQWLLQSFAVTCSQIFFLQLSYSWALYL